MTAVLLTHDAVRPVDLTTELNRSVSLSLIANPATGVSLISELDQCISKIYAAFVEVRAQSALE